VRTRRRAALALLLCLIAILVAVPQGIVGAVNRLVTVSYDNPATQILDELTCEKASASNRLLEATERLRAVAETFQRFSGHEADGRASRAALDSRAARSPPAA